MVGRRRDQFELVSGDLSHPAMDQSSSQWTAGRSAICNATTFRLEQRLRHATARHAGIDQFIGEPDLVERGRSAFIRTFTDGLLAAGTPRMVTDPDPANARRARC
jgi:aminoglycoside 6'-N-acetyltransferase